MAPKGLSHRVCNTWCMSVVGVSNPDLALSSANQMKSRQVINTRMTVREMEVMRRLLAANRAVDLQL